MSETTISETSEEASLCFQQEYLRDEDYSLEIRHVHFYLFLTRRRAPVRKRKYKHPVNRMTDKPAVTQRRAVKY
jgi:hypothetical protein